MISSVLKSYHAPGLSHIPGLNLSTIFMKMELTCEDGMVKSGSAARRFKYRVYHKILLRRYSKNIPSEGNITSLFGTVWWQNLDRGTVLSVTPTTINK
jgi:hypothetical protein